MTYQESVYPLQYDYHSI